MKRGLGSLLGLIIISLGFSNGKILSQYTPLALFNFDENLKSQAYEFEGEDIHYVEGIEGQAISLRGSDNFSHLVLDNLSLNGETDFTVQFWIKISNDHPTVLLSQKQFTDKSISSQKNEGWGLYTSGGTFAWSIGSGDRRLNYERENGDKMPLCDGEWHQLTMTYNHQLSEVRLYYDGHNKAIYKVGFDFINELPLVIGTQPNGFNYKTTIWPQIEKGAQQLQLLVDEYHGLGFPNLTDKEFLDFIVDPDKLIATKKKATDSFEAALITSEKVDHLKDTRNVLLDNPYTVFQIMELTALKPISKIYYLENGKIKINNKSAQSFTQQTQLFPSDFEMDQLTVCREVLSSENIANSYAKFKHLSALNLKERIKSINIGVWNIWHGGKHFTLEDDSWDSRMRIAEMIREKDIDVLLMQETYSSGDFIAAELGYYFATTSDWDYRYQGSNISVISRYPIEELYVPLEASFMNIGVKLALSKTQKIYAMSNWYGMTSFPIVYDFHKDRFDESDDIPVFFGGDFNAVPHTDGGDSPASIKLLDSGFIDAFRSLYPDVKKYAGHTHSSGERIDQLYYKGQGLKNTNTEVITAWPGGFPSDHYMIFSTFELKQ